MQGLIEQLLHVGPEVFGPWLYGIVGLITIIESIPFIGMIIPGGFLVAGAGLLIKLEIFSWVPTLLIISSGALIGDCSAFWLGRRLGHTLIIRYGKYVFFQPTHFDTTKKLLCAHPIKTIVTGRFYAITRAIVPFVAGTSGISFKLFFISSIFSSIIWSGSTLVLGYVLGQGFEIATVYVGSIFLGALVVGLFVIYVYKFLKKNKALTDRYQIYPLVLNLVSLYVFAKILDSISQGHRLVAFNEQIQHAIHAVHSPYLTKFFLGITFLASPWFLLIAALSITTYFAYTRKWYYEFVLPVALVGGALSTIVIKYLVAQERPSFALIKLYDFSFPSGHATLSTIFFLLMLYFFGEKITSKIYRRVFYGLLILAILGISFSRLYLDVHWLSDVLAGWALGIFWVTFSIILLQWIKLIQQKTKNTPTSEKL